MATIESKSGQKYVVQVVNSWPIVLDEARPEGFLLLVNDAATDSDSIGILTITGEAAALPVWAAKKYPHLITAVTTTGSTVGVEANLRGAV